MSFWQYDKIGYILRIKLTPNASSCGFGDLWISADGLPYLKAYVTVAPEKGKANAELIKMLAKKLSMAKSSLQIINGETEHLKKIRLTVTASSDDTETKLNSLIKENA
ncbi:MAG: DUF167 domain-containing protein [Alphaproteobacteria bacterium]|nr:DUF167 domain-containing protein [Alphaproteobacteria bacterium]